MNIKLNNLNYRYDVYHMISIFYQLVKIEIGECIDDYSYSIKIYEDYLSIEKNHEEKTYAFNKDLKKGENIRRALFLYFTEETGLELPWGFLIGIRPTKIATSYFESGSSYDEAVEAIKNKYLVREDKARLLASISSLEEKFIDLKSQKINIYIGMPFCRTTCLYCSFASNGIKGKESLVKEYLQALNTEIIEISKYIEKRNFKVNTIYFGGGTPTSVSDEEFYFIMESVSKNLCKFGPKEFTVECGRPDTITEHKLSTMKKFNVTRISINPQTMNDKTLKLIGRAHSTKDVIDKMNLARGMGFNNINMDVIIGLPGEGILEMENTLKSIYALKPDSLTVHGLCIKRGSKLHEALVLNKSFEISSQKTINEMYKLTHELSSKLHMRPYYLYRQKNMIGNMENIGYCLEGKECLYNMEIIEENETIIGLGADAATKVLYKKENRIERFANVKDVYEYNKRVNEMISRKEKLLDTIKDEEE